MNDDIDAILRNICQVFFGIFQIVFGVNGLNIESCSLYNNSPAFAENHINQP